MNEQKIILVVEDSLTLRTAISDALSLAGMRVITAGNGKDGLQMAKSEHPDLILLDLMMPEMDGITMYKFLREDAWGAHVPVIMLTAMKDDKITTWLNNEGLDFLMKDRTVLEDIAGRVALRLGVATQ